MKDLFRGFTVLFFYTSLLIQPKPAEARFGNYAAYQYQERTRPFNESEVAFLAHYVTFIKFTLYLHGLNIKRKIACLGYPELADFYLLDFDSEDSVHQETLQALDGYIQTDDCQTLLNETLPDIMRTFIEMRVQLGLHQANSNEINAKLTNYSMFFGGGPDRQYPEFLQCDALRDPIYVHDTRLCLEQIQSIVDITPRHIVNRRHFIGLDDLASQYDLPEVVDLLPLTWPEVIHASRIFQHHYVNNEITDYSLMRVERPDFQSMYERDEFYRENPMERAIDTYGLEYFRYMAARDYQKPPGLFTEDPEDSAPFKYTEGLAKYPFLAFLVPEVEEVDLNCEQDQFVHEDPRMITLCERYLESLGNENPFTLRVTRRSVASALRTTLDINYEMLETIEEKYPIADLMNEDEDLVQVGDYYRLRSWNQLMKLENLNAQFFSLFPQYENQEQRFVEIMDRRENFIFWTTLGGAVGLSVLCGFIANFWGAAGCLAVAGLGFNGVFYYQAYQEFETNFGMYFAMDITPDFEGELLSLIEFGVLESSLQNLYLETIFLFVGTGAGDIFRRAKNLRRLAQ